VWRKEELPKTPDAADLIVVNSRCWESFRKWKKSKDWVFCSVCKAWFSYNNVSLRVAFYSSFLAVHLVSCADNYCSLHAPRPTQIGHRSASHASSKDSKEQKPQAPKQVCTQQSLNVARRFVDSIDERQGARSLARFALPITLCAPVKSRSVESFALGFSSISGNAEGSNFRLNAACNQRFDVVWWWCCVFLLCSCCFVL
jgi:hypothetical protein